MKPEFLLFILATIDLFLTLIWIYRWNDSKYVRMFKYKIPIHLIEANPIIRLTVKHLGLYSGTLVGYVIVFTIQLILFRMHWILSIIVILVLFMGISLHLKNNYFTSNQKIIKLTIAFNRNHENKRKKRNSRKNTQFHRSFETKDSSNNR